MHSIGQTTTTTIIMTDSYLHTSVHPVGGAGDLAASRKEAKYLDLPRN